jgi:hypothetical protein
MATPMIVLPIERIERHQGRNVEAYMDESPLRPSLTEAVSQALGGAPLSQSPFFAEEHWRFARFPYNRENLAREFPMYMSERLSEDTALNVAAKMPASEWASCLRNSLSHGGIIYLDGEGRQSFGQKTEMLAFVSAKYPDGDFRKSPVSLKILRISEGNFRCFLGLWVEWLQKSELWSALAA